MDFLLQFNWEMLKHNSACKQCGIHYKWKGRLLLSEVFREGFVFNHH